MIGNHNVISKLAELGSRVDIGNFNIIESVVKIGDNTVIRNNVEIRRNTIIGNKCYIDSGVKFSGKCKIGNEVTIRYDSIIARDVEIMDGVYISPQVGFINIPFKDEKKHDKTIIGRDCEIGFNSTIMCGVHITNGVIIGAKSLVLKDITEKGTYVGIPVRRI
jgi:UDP-3-O-[3-hydroxymyristoyl] glucosamine N-acyltransferase